jgi:hypothetical protein
MLCKCAPKHSGNKDEPVHHQTKAGNVPSDACLRAKHEVTGRVTVLDRPAKPPRARPAPRPDGTFLGPFLRLIGRSLRFFLAAKLEMLAALNRFHARLLALATLHPENDFLHKVGVFFFFSGTGAGGRQQNGAEAIAFAVDGAVSCRVVARGARARACGRKRSMGPRGEVAATGAPRGRRRRRRDARADSAPPTRIHSGPHTDTQELMRWRAGRS